MKETDSERKKSSRLKRELERACEGLTFISETDAEVEPFFGPKVDEVVPGSLRSALGDAVRDRPIKMIDTDDFFDKLTVDKRWHNVRQKAMAKKFRRLQDLLERELTDLCIFKVGRIRLDVFIVGVDRERRLAGVRTKAVET